MSADNQNFTSPTLLSLAYIQNLPTAVGRSAKSECEAKLPRPSEKVRRADRICGGKKKEITLTILSNVQNSNFKFSSKICVHLNVAQFFYNISFKQIKFEYISQSRLLNSVATANMRSPAGRGWTQKWKHTRSAGHTYTRKRSVFRENILYSTSVWSVTRGQGSRQNSEIKESKKKITLVRPFLLSIVHTLYLRFSVWNIQ